MPRLLEQWEGGEGQGQGDQREARTVIQTSLLGKWVVRNGQILVRF